MNEILISLYIFMGVILYFRLRAMTNFNSLHCMFIALLSAVPVLLRNLILILEIASRYLIELSFILGGTDAEEINAQIADKTGMQIGTGEKGDE